MQEGALRIHSEYTQVKIMAVKKKQRMLCKQLAHRGSYLDQGSFLLTEELSLSSQGSLYGQRSS